MPLFDYTKPLFIDLFTGGGSVYTNVVDKYQRVLINDIISDLVAIHKQLINNPDGIIEDVKKLSDCKDDHEKYNELRKSYNNENTPEKLWALMLTCMSNFLRFNSNGIMNQSWGRRGWNSSTEKKVVDFVKHISQYKQKIFFSSVNFSNVPINSEAMYYCDPPYGFIVENGKISNDQISEAGYNNIWKQKDDIKLYNYLREIDKKGGSFMLSGLLNHNNKISWIMSELINDGFRYVDLDFDYKKVSKNGDKNSQEIVIMNY
jgi:DNA adenine methylase Dam